MKIIMCGGGTGGHINPALAIANELKKRNKDAQIIFIGTKRGMENDLVPRAGYELRHVEVMGFKRKLTLSNINAAIKAITSVIAAKKIIKSFKPDLVVGTGGYVSWAPVKAAAKMGIPCLIHEQNAFPGVTTKMLSGYVNKICVSYEESKKFFDASVQNKIILTGNPIKAEKHDYKKTREKYGLKDNEIYIVSYGGSLGADKVNQAVIELMENFSVPQNIRHIHATGKGGYEKYYSIAKEKGLTKHKNIEIVDFIYDMPERQLAADVLICRGGALTFAELAFLGKAAVFIPSPNVAEDHQYKNAKVMADADAGIVIRESELKDGVLTEQVKKLCNDNNLRKLMQKNIKKFSKEHATKEIADAAMKIIKK